MPMSDTISIIPMRTTDAIAQSSYVHKRIADEIGASIVCGRRAVGSLLPKEMDAAVDLGVSRTAYRGGGSTVGCQGFG